MVKMAVGQKNCFQRKPTAYQEVQDDLRGVAGIDDNAGGRIFLMENVAVGLVRSQSEGV